MSQPELMETLSNENEEYSEWRLLHSRGLRGSTFDTVVVNEGFQNKDFQTNQGVFSVIDPEILGKLRKEASTIAMIDAKVAALVESYQPRFLNEYGVELGYDKFSSSPQGRCSSKVPGIYLRRPRRMVDEEDAPLGRDCDDLDGERIPPIYVFRLIPGEIDIGDKVYDASSMKIDSETWALLQSTHEKRIRWHPSLKCLAILCFIGSLVVEIWVANQVGVIVGQIISFVYILLVFNICECVSDRLNRRACEEVTKVVNKALQKDKNKAHLAVEFHDSELPGREGKLGRRYRFVELALTPTRNELV